MKIQIETKNKIGIYCLLNINNNKRYVGSSVNIYNRLLSHRSNLRNNKHPNQYLQNSYNKHGEKQFLISILEYCNIEQLAEREQYYINLLNSEYNIVKDVIRQIPSKESILKQSITRKRMFSNKELIPNCIKSIDVYNLKGEKINTFSSINETSEKLNISRSSITRNLKKEVRKVKDYIFISKKEIQLEDLIFPIKGDKLVVYYQNEKIIIFRSQSKCASYFKVPLVSIEKFFSSTKKEFFKNKFKLGLVKLCELLEHLEADNQQPSNIEIY